MMLETAPSLSIYSNNIEDSIEVENESVEKDDNFNKKVTVEGSCDFSFIKANMGLIKEEDDEINDGKLSVEIMDQQPNSPPMYLATGIGLKNDAFDFDDLMVDEISEDYFRDLLDDYPNHPIVLKKYAQLLQRKGDLQGAEEYSFRATQADPGDGEILAQYAQLIWELHRDHERALTYFDLAAQTAPDNSTVMAAYAKFLWETDDDGEHQSARPDSIQEDSPDVIGANPDDVESYYKRMITENPSQPIFLKKYAQFLYQSKRDLQGAEEYYSRAIQAEPQDGEMLSQFGILLWELYHNQDRTLSYLERAIEASPQDSDVLAAYARFLWSIDDE